MYFVRIGKNETSPASQRSWVRIPLKPDSFFRISFLQLFINRVRTGHGKPGKTWNFRISFSRPGKSWNLGVGHYVY